MLANTAESTATAQALRINRWGDAVLLVVCASLACVSSLPFHDGLTFRWRTAITLALAAGVLWTFSARALHQYDAGSGRGVLGDLALTSVGVAGVVVPLALVSWVLPRLAGFGDVVRFASALLPVTLLLRIRLVSLRLWRGRPTASVLIAGVAPLGRLTGLEIARSDEPRRVAGYLRFEDETGAVHLPAPELGPVSSLEEALRVLVVDEVYIASSSVGHHREIQASIRTCERLGVPFAVPSCAYRLARAHPNGQATDGYTHFSNGHHKPIQRLLKRAFDIAAPALALAALSPLLLVVAAAVKLTSAGPVLFRQDRVGLLGRVFPMLKFRSMVNDAEARKAMLLAENEQNGPVFKMKRDPRVTPLGRFLRKYSIDELPQLVNVLRGDMSIVGPRPPLPSEVARYEGWQRRRLSVRPGLTCVWQVSGRNDCSFENWMLLDMRYIDHWSLFGDFDLIARTVPVVLTGRGAS